MKRLIVRCAARLISRNLDLLRCIDAHILVLIKATLRYEFNATKRKWKD